MTPALASAGDRMGARESTVLISMLMALTALAIDMMLPSFGSLRLDLGLDEDSNALAPIVTVFLVGLGVGQLVFGPLSDALGRKRVLWLGLAIYVLGALGAALSPALGVLLVWRLVGGLGAGAVRVAAISTVRDRYEGEAMARVLSYIMAVFILVPVVAPSLGAAVLTIGSWRLVFLVLVIAGLAAALWVTRLPESLAPRSRIPLDRSRLILAARSVMASRFVMGLTVAQTAVFGFFASWLASSELIIGDVFDLAEWFPLIFGVTALVLGAGMLANPRALDRLGLRRWLRTVMTGYLLATLSFAAIALVTAGSPPFWLFMAGLAPILLAQGFVIPNLNSAAMMPVGNMAGTAAAIIGVSVTLGGAAIGAIIDRSFDGSVTPIAIAGVLVGALGWAAYRWADAVWSAAPTGELEGHTTRPA